jgi:TRAP-type C4-dicarboxylate transport system permease small subunit
MVEGLSHAIPLTVRARAPDCRTGENLIAMRATINWLDQKVEYVLNVLLYAYILIIVFLEVLARYVLHVSLVWAEETAVYAFIWLSYLSMARLARTRTHLAFTPLRDMLPRGGQLVCLLIADVALGVLAVIVVVYMWRPIADAAAFGQTMQGSDLPIWIATLAVPVGWMMVLLRTTQRAIDAIRNYRRGDVVAEEHPEDQVG